MTTQLPLALIDALKTVSDSEGVPAYQMQSDSSPENAVRMVPLEDVDGKLQVICRQVDLLDVTLLNKQLGRDFRAINRRELRRLTSRLKCRRYRPCHRLRGGLHW